MALWILTSVPPWLILLVLLAAIIGVALATLRYIRLLLPGLHRGEHKDIARFGFTVVGMVYGFIIGFIVLSLCGQIDACQTRWRTEVESAIQIPNGPEVPDKADRDRIWQSLLDYERAVLAEWPQAATGSFSPQADDAPSRLYKTYDSIQPRNDFQHTALASSMETLKQSTMQRRERVLAARTLTGPGFSLWLVILMTSALVVSFAIVFGATQARMHYAMVGVVAALLASNIFLIVELAYPFTGEIAASSASLDGAIGALQSRQ